MHILRDAQLTGETVRQRIPSYDFAMCVPSLLASVKALVRWATGKRLTNRLPKLGLITLSPPLNSGILGLRMGPYVPTPRFFYSL